MYQKSIYEKAMLQYRKRGKEGLDELAIEEHLHCVKIPSVTQTELDEVIAWCKEHCPVMYFYYIDTFYFERVSDAVMFKLRYG